MPIFSFLYLYFHWYLHLYLIYILICICIWHCLMLVAWWWFCYSRAKQLIFLFCTWFSPEHVVSCWSQEDDDHLLAFKTRFLTETFQISSWSFLDFFRNIFGFLTWMDGWVDPGGQPFAFNTGGHHWLTHFEQVYMSVFEAVFVSELSFCICFCWPLSLKEE